MDNAVPSRQSPSVQEFKVYDDTRQPRDWNALLRRLSALYSSSTSRIPTRCLRMAWRFPGSRIARLFGSTVWKKRVSSVKPKCSNFPTCVARYSTATERLNLRWLWLSIPAPRKKMNLATPGCAGEKSSPLRALLALCRFSSGIGGREGGLILPSVIGINMIVLGL